MNTKKKSIKRNEPTTLLKMQKIILVTFQLGIEDIKKLDYVKYLSNIKKSSGVFNQNGFMDAKQKQALRSDLRATKSVIWDGIISFEEQFGKKWCEHYEQAYELLKTELPKFFKRAGLDPNNIEWFAGLHENTDNRHIHICFFEKEAIKNKTKQK